MAFSSNEAAAAWRAKNREKVRELKRNAYARERGFKDHEDMMAHKVQEEAHVAPFKAKGWRTPWEIVGWDYAKYQKWLKGLATC